MMVRLFDVQAGFGGPPPWPASAATAAGWLEEMARLDIARALVRTAPDALGRDPRDMNEELYAVCSAQPGLAPCPIVVPNACGDVPTEEEQVARAVSEGAGAVFVRPKEDLWCFEAWCSGRLFAALEGARLPVYCENGKCTLPEVAALAERYPGLPIILAKVHYLQQRSLTPLLEAFPNIYLSIGSNYVVHGGVEFMVDRLGGERLLFGTGFPEAEPMGAITMLMYAGISDEARRLIGAVNMERLMEGIRA